jgi:hypothetical protein
MYMIFGGKKIRALDFQFISCSLPLNGEIATRPTPNAGPDGGGGGYKIYGDILIKYVF